MSDTEAIMWAVEKDPALRSDFCNLTILERTPDEDRLGPTLDRALAAIPRLGQRVVGAPLRIATPAFADDPMLDLNAHIRHVAVPGKGTDRDLLDLCGALAEQPLDRARPLWEFTLIEGMADGRTALLQKVHHTITDGIGGLKLSLAFVDFEPDPPADQPRILGPAERDGTGPGPGTPLQATSSALADAANRNLALARRAIGGTTHVLTRPHQLPARAADVLHMAGSLQRQVFNTDPARSDVMHGRSLPRHFETYATSLPAVQAVARKLGGSVNDAYVTALAGALGRYHERFGSSVDALRLAMPISTRDRGDDAANRFVPARVVVPVKPTSDPSRLFDLVREQLAIARGESAITVAESFAGFLTALPTSVLVALTRAQTRTTDFAATNLRGSPVPLYIAGARVVASYPFGPRTGTALNATVLSYCDELHLGLNIDPAAVIDVDGFMVDVDDSFAALLSLV
jgi:WS/DGAT/MGAT family acyltransferase